MNSISPNIRNSRNFDSRFNKAYRQYVAEIEGESDGDGDGQTSDSFNTFLMTTNETDPTNDDEDSGEGFFTSVDNFLAAPSDATIPNAIVDDLTSLALLHELTGENRTVNPDDSVVEDPQTFTTASGISRYDSEHFYGIVIDTGASKFSTAGVGQFEALQRLKHGVVLNKTDTVNITFGIGSTSSIGSALVETPVGQVEFHIMPSKTPFLLSLADMDKLKVYYNNISDFLVTSTGKTVPVVRRFGHAFLMWNNTLRSFICGSLNFNPCFLTETELRTLHRRFGHPSAGRLQDVLERAGHDVERDVLNHLTKFCSHCQKHGRSPGRFRFTLKDDVNYNYSIIVDIFYINGKPVLHIVDQATRFQAGGWLKNLTAKHTWEVLKMRWIDTYLGPPEQITVDAGKQFASKEFAEYADVQGMKIKIVPVEAHHSIGIVERYHGPIRRAYKIITDEIKDISADMALQMAFKAVNDTAGPDGLVPTLLVFGAYPRMTEQDAPSATVAQRAHAVRRAMAEIQRLRAKRQVNDALNTRNGPSTTTVHDLALNSDVLLWREGNAGKTGHWDGPFKLVSMDGESCVLAVPYGNATFRSTSIKPFYAEEQQPQRQPDEQPTEQPKAVETPPQDEPGEDTIVVDTGDTGTLPERVAQPPKRGRGRSRKNPDLTVFLEAEETFVSMPFEDSRLKEVKGLVDKGVFDVTKTSEIPEGTRIFSARFVDEVKNKGTDKEFNKSRLVVQAYNDQNKHEVLTESPTLTRIHWNWTSRNGWSETKGIYMGIQWVLGVGTYRLGIMVKQKVMGELPLGRSRQSACVLVETAFLGFLERFECWL